MARCLVAATPSRKRTTSPGLGTTGSLLGCLGAGRTSGSFQSLPKVTP